MSSVAKNQNPKCRRKASRLLQQQLVCVVPCIRNLIKTYTSNANIHTHTEIWGPAAAAAVNRALLCPH
jgi:hypothetical protein